MLGHKLVEDMCMIYSSGVKSVKTSTRESKIMYNSILGRGKGFTREIRTLVWSYWVILEYADYFIYFREVWGDIPGGKSSVTEITEMRND